MAGAPRRQPHVHPLLPALLALIVVGVVVLVIAGTTGDDDGDATAPVSSTTTTTTAPPETTTTTTTTLPDPVPPGDVVVAGLDVAEPTTYRIDYEVVENGLARDELWTVQRPYRSLIESRRDGELLSGTATSPAALYTYLSDREGWLDIQPELHRAAFDSRVAGAIGALEQLGLVERSGEREVAGRVCTEYVTGQPLSAGEVTAPSAGESTMVCIDGAGLVLWEAWQIDGNTISERTARAVEIEPDVDPAAFDPGPRIEDADAFNAALQIIAVPADETTLDQLRTEYTVPEGYTEDGAVFRGVVGSGGSGQEIVRFFSSGPDLLEVAEHSVDGPAELGRGAAVRVDVEGWDEVWIEPGFRNSTLRARLTSSSYVELRHHDLALLLTVFESLVVDDS